MPSPVEWHPDPNAEKALAVLIDTHVAKTAGAVRDGAKRIIRAEGRINTGAMVQSIESRKVGERTYEVGSRLNYAIYQHEGVKGPIYPRRAKVLRFKPKGGSGFVFARKVSGFKGIHFLTRALEQVRTSPPR